MLNGSRGNGLRPVSDAMRIIFSRTSNVPCLDNLTAYGYAAFNLTAYEPA
jgi:hypothetical protein